MVRSPLQILIALLIGFQLGIWLSFMGVQHPPQPAEHIVPIAQSEHNKRVVPGKALPTGWHPVYVFSGGLDLLLDREDYTRDFASHSIEHPKWSGQIHQDDLVYQLLGQKRNGFFVELAANDAVYLSNTFALEQYYGWKGICVEGNPMYWEWLAFRDCTVVGSLVGRTKGEELEVNFGTSDGETGGIQPHHLQNPDTIGQQKKPNTRRKRTTTLMEILQTFDAPTTIDFLSLDVEGAEEFIMRGFDFDRFTFSIMTVERPTSGLANLLREKGYRRVLNQIARFGETLWVHKSFRLTTTHKQAIDTWCRTSNKDTCHPRSLPAGDLG